MLLPLPHARLPECRCPACRAGPRRRQCTWSHRQLVLALAPPLARRTGFMLPMLEWVCERAYLDCELVFQDTMPDMLQALVDVS